MAAKAKNKILIVDEDPLNILVLDEILGEDYDLLKAGTADEAIQLASDFRPDLILLDVMMPGSRNGFEVCERLRSDKHLQLTKIILVSSKAMLRDRLRGYKAGADDYISKPFDIEELRAKVRIFIRLKSVEEIDRAKDDLINLFSHETKTPLHSILGFAKFLKDSPSMADEDKESLDIIAENAATLLQLVEKTILISSLRKEHRAPSLAAANLGELLGQALADMKAALAGKGIDTKLELEFIGAVKVDVELLRICLEYLLDNAIKFTPQGGGVKIGSRVAADGRLLLDMADAGPGIPPERVNTLFDEFGVEDISHHGRGHALSLAIVKYIMEMHGGVIKAANAETGGAVFTLSFPAETMVAAAAESAAATEGGEG